MGANAAGVGRKSNALGLRDIQDRIALTWNKMTVAHLTSPCMGISRPKIGRKSGTDITVFAVHDVMVVSRMVHFMPQPVANSVVAMFRGIGSPKLPFQNQSAEKSFAR